MQRIIELLSLKTKISCIWMYRYVFEFFSETLKSSLIISYNRLEKMTFVMPCWLSRTSGRKQ